jgi:hypothetical protein
VGSLRVDRLSLQVPGRETRDARDMAVEIMTRLAAAGGLPAAGDFPALRIEVPMAPNERSSDLTARIVAEALRQMQRGSA